MQEHVIANFKPIREYDRYRYAFFVEPYTALSFGRGTAHREKLTPLGGGPHEIWQYSNSGKYAYLLAPVERRSVAA
jgi:hypothetical protein